MVPKLAGVTFFQAVVTASYCKRFLSAKAVNERAAPLSLSTVVAPKVPETSPATVIPVSATLPAAVNLPWASTVKVDMLVAEP